MVLVDALYINKGGGAVLLEYLIENILVHQQDDHFFFLLDPRFEKPEMLHKNYAVIPNKVSERIKFYKKESPRFSKVFCFANTPPPIKLKVPVYTYFHNQKLLEAPKQWFKKPYWRIYIKYLFVKLYNKNTDYYIVQTTHMVDALMASGLKDEGYCLTIPFYDNKKYIIGNKPFNERARDEFIFISNPSPQKNHITLLDAWEYLLENGHTPILHVTIDSTGPQFLTRINTLNSRGSRIINHVYVDPRKLYFNCPYLIFPSVMESFGLPLIEAADSGMKVLASDLPYVYDVIKPSLTFDPFDKISIAGSVIKALDATLPFPEILTQNEIGKLIQLLLA